MQWEGRSYLLPRYSVTIVLNGTVLFQSANTSAAPRTTRTFANLSSAGTSPMGQSCLITVRITIRMRVQSVST